jgi:hypothetical protein
MKARLPHDPKRDQQKKWKKQNDEIVLDPASNQICARAEADLRNH